MQETTQRVILRKLVSTTHGARVRRLLLIFTSALVAGGASRQSAGQGEGSAWSLRETLGSDFLAEIV